MSERVSPSPPRVPPTLDDRLAEIQRGMEKDGWHSDHHEAIHRARARITALEAALGVAEKALREVTEMLEDQDHRQWSMSDNEFGCKDCGTDFCPTRKILPSLKAALEAIRSEGEK